MQQKSMIGAYWPTAFPAMHAPFVAVSALASALVAVGAALLYGATARAELEQQRAVDIQRENDEICTSLGMGPSSGRSACAEALAKVRRLHEERLSREPIL